MVGCTDFSEDIQAGDNALKDQIAGLTQSTNASVSEINSAIDALEKASQELAAEDQKLAQDLAAAKQALENTIASNKTSLESSIDALNAALSQLEAAHNSDKAALETAIANAKSELQGKIDAAQTAASTALANLNAALEALDAAKADKDDFDAVASDVESLKMGYMQTIEQFQNIATALDGKASLADFEKSQADLKAVKNDVESLKMGYMQTVEYLQNINTTLATLGEDMDDAKSDIEALKNETAQLVMASVNIQGTVDAITSRVEVLEEKVAALIQGYQETVAALLQIRADIDMNAGKIEDNATAINALKDAHMLLTNELTNFEYAYLADLEALETYKMSVSKQFSDLQAQDSQLANAMLDYYNQSIAAVDSAIEALTADYTAAIAALEAKITTEWEKERALIYNTIEDIKKTLFAAIEEGDAQNAAQIEALDEAYQLADALIYKTIESYKGILEIAIAEGDQAITEAMDAAVALIYKTIENIQSDLKVEIAEGDAAAIVTMREALDEELALVYKTIASIQSELKAEIAQGDADIQAAMDAAVALIYKTIASTKEEVQAELAEAKNELTATIDDAVALIYKTIENTKKELQSEIADLRNEFTTITDVLAGDIAKIKTDIQNINTAIAGLQEAKTAMEGAIDELQAQDGQLAKSIISYYEQAIAAVDDAVADLQAKIDANADDIEANAEAVANAMIKIGEVETALNTAIDELTAQDAQLAGSILSFHEQALAAAADVANNLETAIGRIDELEDALDALKELGKEKLEALQDADAALAAQIEEKTTNVMNMLLTVVVAAEDRANDKIAQLRTLVNDAHLFIEELRAQINKIEVDVQGLKTTLAALQTALDAAKKELGDKDAVMANTLDGLKKLCKDQQDLIGANIDNIYKNAQDIAVLYLQVADLVERMNDADDFSAQLNNTIEQLSSQMWEMFGLVDTQLGAITEAYTAADAEIRAELEAGLAEVLELAIKNDSGVMDNVRQFELKVNAIVEELRAQISNLTKRVQSLVYVPEYSDGKANVHYGATINLNANVLNLTDVAFVPAKTTLRYKVNSTSATIVDDIVKAYEANRAILSYDVEGVKVRGASANGATLEVVGVSKDKDGYLAVDVLAKNFDKSFYLSSIKNTDRQNNSILGGIWDALFGDNATSALDKLIALSETVGEHKGYSAALVLSEAETVNNVASEFTNLIADKNYDLLQLGARYQAAGKDIVLTALQSVPVLKSPYANADHIIASSDTETSVMTTASEPVVQISKGGNLETYTPEDLYEKYGYKVEIEKHRHVVSYAKGGKLDATGANANWAADVNAYNTDKFIVNDADAIGTSRSVKLVAYDEANKVKYDERVGSYIDVVDVYYLNGQSVAVADKVTITKNLVYIKFTPQTYNWTLQKAINLRAEDKTPYGNDLVFYDVTYDNIYGLQPILESGNVLAESLKLNGTDDAAVVKVSAIEKPVAGKAGSATVAFEGYKFSAETANNYVKTWRVDLNETTEAVITFEATLSKLPAAVEVKSNVDLDLVAGQTYFDGKDELIADAYAAFGAANAGFATDAKANDLMFAALTDAKNTMVNGPEPASLYNLNFNVTNNEDKTFVRLYKEQFEGSVPPATYTFTRDITTWFGVPFKFVVTATPKLPLIGLVRSTEYASATAEAKVYSVNLQARVNEAGVYTVVQSDLAYYLNVIGAVNDTQYVTYEVLDDAVSTIANSTVDVQPLETPIDNPLLGKKITAYLEKDQAQLTWKDKGTQIKVKATLWASVYPIDEATLILNVEDPISFSAASIDVPRIVEDDTPVNVWKNFSLSSTAKKFDGTTAHPGDLINREAKSIKDIISTQVKDAYGINVGVEMVTIYEQTEAGNVLYDASKYDDSKLESDGILVLKRDDAAVLLNPIVAQIRVTFEHNVHGVGDKCSETTDIFVKFYQN